MKTAFAKVIGLIACFSLTQLPMSVAPAQTVISKQIKYDCLTPEMVKEDKRLLTPITMDHSSVSTADLLADISKKIGVTLRTGANDGSGDDNFAVYCKDTPAYKILNALWSSVSNTVVFWSWERSSEGGTYAYRFRQPLLAQKFRQQLHDEVRTKFIADLNKLLSTVDASMEVKEQALRQMYDTPDEDFKKEHGYSKERVLADVRALKELLTPDELNDLLDGCDIDSKKFSDLSHKGKLSYAPEIATSQHPPNDANGRLMFQFHIVDGAPAIRVAVSGLYSPQTLVGRGTSSKTFRNRMRKLFVLEGDSQASSDGKKVMIAPHTLEVPYEPVVMVFNMQYKALDNRNFGPKLEVLWLRFRQLFEANSTPIVARLPLDEPLKVMPVPTKTSMEQYCKSHLDDSPLMYKWRDGVQIFESVNWAIEDVPIPSKWIKNLQQHAVPGQFLPFSELTYAAAQYSQAQILRLVRRFPCMYSLANGRWHMAMIHLYPNLAQQASSKEGLFVDDAVRRALAKVLPSSILRRVGKGPYDSLKLTSFKIEEFNLDNLRIDLELYSKAHGASTEVLNFDNVIQPVISKLPKQP